MPINDVIDDVARREQVGPYDPNAAAMTEGAQAAANQQAQRRARGSMGSIAPLAEFEKTDLHFWVDVATLVVLLLILTKI